MVAWAGPTAGGPSSTQGPTLDDIIAAQGRDKVEYQFVSPRNVEVTVRMLVYDYGHGNGGAGVQAGAHGVTWRWVRLGEWQGLVQLLFLECDVYDGLMQIVDLYRQGMGRCLPVAFDGEFHNYLLALFQMAVGPLPDGSYLCLLMGAEALEEDVDEATKQSRPLGFQTAAEVFRFLWQAWNIMICGFGLDNDKLAVEKIYHRLGTPVKARGVVDLAHAARRPGEQRQRMQAVLALALGTSILKAEHSGDWSGRPLERDQAWYAACDVVYTLRVAEQMGMARLMAQRDLQAAQVEPWNAPFAWHDFEDAAGYWHARGVDPEDSEPYTLVRRLPHA